MVQVTIRWFQGKISLAFNCSRIHQISSFSITTWFERKKKKTPSASKSVYIYCWKAFILFSYFSISLLCKVSIDIWNQLLTIWRYIHTLALLMLHYLLVIFLAEIGKISHKNIHVHGYKDRAAIRWANLSIYFSNSAFAISLDQTP